MIKKYGHNFPDCYSDIAIEFFAFSEWLDAETGGLGRLQHLKNILKTVWPDRDYTPWDAVRAQQFCAADNWVVRGDQRFHAHANVGCAASGKTDWWATLGTAWWLADPMNSSVIITSIQKKMVRQRSWAIIQKLYHSCPDKFGNFVDSQMEWQAKKGDSLHSVCALAVGEGETQKAVQRLAGLHCPRIMVIVDEAPATSEAIFQVVSNIRKGTKEFVIVAAGNAISRNDPHGRMCEPVRGWNSVDENTETWATKGVPEWSVEPGVCIHFHGARSPNVKACRNIYPYLFSYENWQESKGKEDSLYHWVYNVGFWAPEGMSNTVFDEAVVQRVGGMDKVTWESDFTPMAALDPAFGGDACTLVLGKMGKPQQGPLCLEVGQRFILKLKQKSPEPIHYQIARQVREICERNKVLPGNFAMDSTGNGGGVASVLEAEWSPLINRVEFGGLPSTMPVSAYDGRPCNEVYDRKVTELWFNARELLDGGQLKGLDRETVIQFCKRMYDLKTRKKRIETKDECKARLGRSPDDADAVAVLVWVARMRGLTATGIPRSKSKTDTYIATAREVNDVFEDEPQIASPEHDFMAWMEN
jgi:hypothetical protein